MANEEPLNILKEGFEIWNQWREKNPDVDLDLSFVNLQNASLRWMDLGGVNLEGADLEGADLGVTNLGGANLYGANLNRAYLVDADLRGADLSEADLYGTNLAWANLEGANLSGANFYGAILNEANLSRANLSRANLNEARLTQTILEDATLTGACLSGTSLNDWIISGIHCDFVYSNAKPHFDKKSDEEQWEREHRVPRDRDFRLGEFEERYRQLQTFEYYFEQDFTPIDTVIINQAVQMINQKHPEFELCLDSFHSRGLPHTVFTVLQKEYVETALKQISMFYEDKLTKLEGKREQLWEAFTLLTNQPQINIQELIMGNQTKKIAKRDFYEHGTGSPKATEVSQPEVHKQQALPPENNQGE